MFEEIKKHPYVLGAAVLGIIVLFFLSSSGGGGTVVASDSGEGSSDVAAAEATNQAGIMANAQIQSDQISLAGLKEQIGGSIAIATLQAHTADNANELSAAVAGQQINAEHASVDLANTLSAQTQQRYFQSTENLAAINTAGMIANTNAIASALVQQAQISSNTTLGVAAYNTQTTLGIASQQAAIAQQQIAASEHVATQSWWDKIF